MRKNNVRDYATAAFRFYAQTGSSAKYKKKVWDDAIELQRQLEEKRKNGDTSCPTESAIIRADIAVQAASAELNDLEAVEKVKTILENSVIGKDIWKAVEFIYMAEPQKDIGHREICDRVHKFGITLPASERQVYRWLATACDGFAEARGLRRQNI